MDKTPLSADSTAKLSEAIRKLEDYSLQQIKSAERSSVSKTIGLVRSILIDPFDTRLKKHKHQSVPPDKKEVLTAIEFINRNRLFIEKLKEGTPAEQELAEKVTRTINSYNENCDKRIQGYFDKGRLANFFSKDKKEPYLPKIAMLKRSSVQRHYPENFAYKAIHKPHTSAEVSMSKQWTELFQMKAIVLLERRGIASNAEARALVKNSPIYTAVKKDNSVCTITQTFSLFPGQLIVIKGNAALNPKTQAINQLMPESFTLDVPQTGFPHSIQRTGWALASQLIPDSPQRIDLLDHSSNLFQRRNKAIGDLLKHGNVFKHAKTLFTLKKEVFAEYAAELIELHETLAMAILRAASANNDAFQTVRRFFDHVRANPHLTDAIAETSQDIRQHFMAMPHQILLDAIIKGKSTDLGSNNPELRFSAAKAILDQAVDRAQQEYHPSHHDVENLDERIKSAYIGCMGTILGRASKPIFLQYLSEDLVFTPPALTNFENQVQGSAYLHLKDFLDELSMPLESDPKRNKEKVYQLLKKQLNADIALFRGESRSDITNELADYFRKRYSSLSSI